MLTAIKWYDIKENMEVLELSLKENFQDVFVSHLNSKIGGKMAINELNVSVRTKNQ